MARRITMSVYAVLALFAVTASAAQASIAQSLRPDDRPGIREVGLAVTQPSAATRPDDRPGIRQAGVVTHARLAAARPDDRPGIRVFASPSPVVQTAAAAGASFQWGDAATGAGVTLAVIALAGAFVALTIRRRERVSAAPSA